MRDRDAWTRHVVGLQAQQAAAAQPSKYRAVKAEVDGVTFHSKREAKRYQTLKLLEQGGHISDLQVQPQFALVVNNIRLGEYRADFGYLNDKGEAIFEDCKGHRTDMYIWKRKHCEAQYGVTIRET